MNIRSYNQFRSMVNDFLKATVVAVDTETNGLKVFEGNRPISMSLYFPEFDTSYNLAWAHGEGEVFVPKANRNMSKFHSMKWTGKGKKQAYKQYWWGLFKSEQDFGNVPMEWLVEFRDVWNDHIDAKRVIFFNASFDIHMLDTIDFRQPVLAEDVLIAVNLVFEDWQSIGGSGGLKWQAAYHKIDGALDGEEDLKAQAQAQSLKLAEYIAERWDDPINDTFHKLKRAARPEEIAKKVALDPKSEMWMLPSEAVAKYAENDTKITWKLREHLRGILDQWHQWQLYLDICAVQNEFAIRMEKNGVLLDADRAEKLIEEMGPIMDEVTEWFIDQLDATFYESNSDIARVLGATRRELERFSVGSSKKLPVALAVLTGVDWKKSDKDAIERYERVHGHHEAVDQLKRYRHAQRAVKTYLSNWVKSQDDDGYIHFAFNVVGAKTGRWSSSSGTLGDTGNGQNIPSRGFRIKEALTTPEGWTMYQADYGQIELRLAAGFAGCKPMIKLVEEGADLHAYTRDQMGVGEILHPAYSTWQRVEALEEAGKLKKRPESDEDAHKAVQSYYRAVAKVLNFGLLYSGTWRMVSQLLKLDEWTARELHRGWNNLYPEYEKANADWTEQALTRRPRPDGTGRTLLYAVQPLSGRTRKFGFYPTSFTYFDKDRNDWRTFNPREAAAKDAFNFAVQGAAAYIMSMSGLRVARAFDDRVFRPWAVIHDSLNFYLKQGHENLLPEITAMMTDWDVNPRLAVDVEVARDGRWQNLEEIEDMAAFVTERTA